MEHTDTISWALSQIHKRLVEWTRFQQLVDGDLHTEANHTEYDELDERTNYSFQEIMKIAFLAQIDLDTEYDEQDKFDRTMDLLHYLTGDPTEIEVVIREP